MQQDKVSVGPTTIAGSTVTLAAFALAVVAFAQGARDEETFSALAVGALSLVTVLAGRFGQAIAKASYGTGLEQPDPPPPGSPVWAPTRAVTTVAPRPSVAVSHGETGPPNKSVVDDLGHGEG